MPARERLDALVAELGLEAAFDPVSEAEARAFLSDPGVDDRALEDRRALPFVTIDGEASRDLDQAMCIERRAGGYRLWYALADASHFAPVDSALFAGALERGATYYFPGFALPMLPRVLSEGLVSLNEGEPRRALLMRIDLDRAGAVEETHLERARVQSRRKLSYRRVSAHHAGRRLDGEAFTETLDLLKELGELRIEDATRRDVVRFDRRHVEIDLDAAGDRLTTSTCERDAAELWNEQISILANAEGARFLRRAKPGEQVQPIFRVHEAPPEVRVRELVAEIDALVAEHRLDPARWGWRRGEGESLARYLARLPAEARLTRAIHRKALLINQRSLFTVEPGRHHGVGVDEYSRFTAPMREVVGVFTHKEAFEQLEGRGRDDRELSARVVEAGNRSKAVQAQIAKAAHGLLLDQMFEQDLAAGAPWRGATLMGASASKLYLELDDPPLDLKIYRGGREPTLPAGAPLAVRARGRESGRWMFDLRP